MTQRWSLQLWTWRFCCWRQFTAGRLLRNPFGPSVVQTRPRRSFKFKTGLAHPTDRRPGNRSQARLTVLPPSYNRVSLSGDIHHQCPKESTVTIDPDCCDPAVECPPCMPPLLVKPGKHIETFPAGELAIPRPLPAVPQLASMDSCRHTTDAAGIRGFG